MSGLKRKIEDNDPDYEDISLIQSNKRNKAAEHDGECMLWSTSPYVSCSACYDRVQLIVCLSLTAREATVQKIETIIREQFSLEMKNKEHEIDVISQVSLWF